MKNLLMAMTALTLLAAADPALATSNATKGAIGGAVGGAVVAGPVGLVVGGVGGALVGKHWRGGHGGSKSRSRGHHRHH